MPNDFFSDSVGGLNVCQCWLVTTAMAVGLSRKIAVPVLSAQGAHSNRTAIWQACFESFTTVHPAGTVCAQAGRTNKKSRDETTCFLLAGFYRQPIFDTRLLCRFRSVRTNEDRSRPYASAASSALPGAGGRILTAHGPDDSD